MSDKLLNIDDTNFETESASGGLAMLDFYATWCGLQTLEPVVSRLATSTDRGSKSAIVSSRLKASPSNTAFRVFRPCSFSGW